MLVSRRRVTARNIERDRPSKPVPTFIRCYVWNCGSRQKHHLFSLSEITSFDAIEVDSGGRCFSIPDHAVRTGSFLFAHKCTIQSDAEIVPRSRVSFQKPRLIEGRKPLSASVMVQNTPERYMLPISSFLHMTRAVKGTGFIFSVWSRVKSLHNQRALSWRMFRFPMVSQNST